MKPYYESETVTVYHAADMLEWLIWAEAEGLQVDAVITDPPYCSGAAKSGGKTADPATKYCQGGNTLGRPTFSGDAKDQLSFVAWETIWLSRARRLVKPAGYALVFSDWRQLPATTMALQGADWTWRGLVTWDKGRAARTPHTGFFKTQCEYISWGTNGRCEKRPGEPTLFGCYQFSVRKKDKHHMTGKPTDLMRELVKCVPAGGTVLDLFGGSGTTAVAAHLEGRKAIVVEREEAYCEITVERLEVLH